MTKDSKETLKLSDWDEDKTTRTKTKTKQHGQRQKQTTPQGGRKRAAKKINHFAKLCEPQQVNKLEEEFSKN